MASVYPIDSGAQKARAECGRREFLQGMAAAALAGPWIAASGRAACAAEDGSPEAVVKRLYDSLSPAQRKAVCFDWDYMDPKRGLLRTRIAANWRITEQAVKSDFYTEAQQRMIRTIFEGLIRPEWHARFDRQLQDDDEGFGTKQTIAVFGRPGAGPFQFVLTGRHMTLRCDGDDAGHHAFGGPVFYGHAASGFREKPGHPGNIFWDHALAANAVFAMFDGRQQKAALVKQAPAESAVGFRGRGGAFPGIPVADLTRDQQAEVEKVLQKLIEPYRDKDRKRVLACLEAQGGLEACHLAFYEEGDQGADRVWDIWRLEGPALVWHFRGTPHVHTWVHVADDPRMPLNADRHGPQPLVA